MASWPALVLITDRVGSAAPEKIVVGLVAVLVVYIGLNVFYSTWLKRIPVVDIFCVAAGFVLRVYAGAVGYFGFDGQLDSCIALRSVVLKDGTAYVQAGGGVVADSVPELEYQESVNKAMATFRAIERAEQIL